MSDIGNDQYDFVHQYKVKTQTSKHGLIESEVTDLAGKIRKMVINTQEAQIRQALIDLGWTPPGNDR